MPIWFNHLNLLSLICRTRNTGLNIVFLMLEIKLLDLKKYNKTIKHCSWPCVINQWRNWSKGKGKKKLYLDTNIIVSKPSWVIVFQYSLFYTSLPTLDYSIVTIDTISLDLPFRLNWVHILKLLNCISLS